MNFLIQSTTLNYKINHRIAVQLKKLYPNGRFGVIISAHGGKRKELIEQDELEYEFVHDIQNIEVDFLKQDYSIDELETFEEGIPEKSIWRLIAMDRHFGRAFCKGAHKYFDNRQITSGDVKRDDILRVVCGYIRFFKGILRDLDADVVLFFPGFHSMMLPILQQACREQGILFLGLVGARVQNNYLITEDVRCTFPKVEETYRAISEGLSQIDLVPGRQCYEAMLSAVGKAGYSYHHKSVKKRLQLLAQKKKSGLNYPYLMGKAISRSVLTWHRKRRTTSTRIKGTYLYGASYLWRTLYYNVVLDFQSKKLLSNKFYDEYDPSEKYLYYPLTGQPEYATQVMNNMWINQLTIIEALAKSIPCDWLIYVKEHPATIGWRVRPFSFYRELRGYPNVRLIPIDLENNFVVKNSQMVVAISSTAAWEAYLFHDKPIINFSRALYNITGLSKQCTDLTQLSKLIHSEYVRINQMNHSERKRRIVLLINAILKNSISLKDPIATFTGKAKPEDFEMNAETIAQGIKKHIGELN